MLSVIMLGVIMLRVIMLRIIILRVIMLRLTTECHFIVCSYAESYHAKINTE
jgi:hypothetical protein